MIMNKESKPAKSDYQAELREAAEKLAERLMGLASFNEARDIAYDVLREQTLQSWKNGLEAGRKRAQTSRPKRRSASKEA